MSIFPMSTLGPLGAQKTRRTPWWLSGGVSAANCIAAYQPKGAASLAASYANLANPGTYTAAPGVAPTLSNGWIFDGITQYLTTGITPANNQSWSVVIRFSNLTGVSRAFFGCSASSLAFPWFFVEGNNNNGGSKILFANGNFSNTLAGVSQGVLTMAGTHGYVNGVDGLISIPSAAGVFPPVYIGGINNGGVFDLKCSYVLQAICFYNIVLVAAQVSAVTNAINAL